ncbi:MAG: DUF6498-containing protein [Bacteroidetes bacterium]|nr:DUF6498-containing protein [Bacteroidota bacterium]
MQKTDWHKYDYAWVLLNALIPLAGVWFFNWSIGVIVILFVYEIFLGGCAGVVKIIMAMDGREFSFAGLLGKIIPLIAFAFFYSMLGILLSAFLIKPLDTKHLFNSEGNFLWSIRLLTFNYIFHFISTYILTGKFKTTSAAGVIFSNAAYLFPLGIIVMFIINPFTSILHSGNINAFVITLFIIAKTGIDALIVRFQTNNREKQNQTNF